MQYDVIYSGYSLRMLLYLSKSKIFHLIACFSNGKRIDVNFTDMCNQLSIPLINITNKRDIAVHTNLMDEADIIIMYRFEFIIPEDIIRKYKIINFHGGSLRTNRGPHAPVWSILNMDKRTCLSMYELSLGGVLMKGF